MNICSFPWNQLYFDFVCGLKDIILEPCTPFWFCFWFQGHHLGNEIMSSRDVHTVCALYKYLMNTAYRSSYYLQATNICRTCFNRVKEYVRVKIWSQPQNQLSDDQLIKLYKDIILISQQCDDKKHTNHKHSTI